VHWDVERLRQAGAIAALLALSVLPARGGAGAADAPAIDYKGSLAACHDPVCLTGSNFQGTTTHVTWHDITIVYSMRATLVKGDLAEGTFDANDSKNSHWVMTGHVQIFMPQGHLSADNATMQIVDDRVTLLTAQGAPALFERADDAPLPPNANGGTQQKLEHAHGHAREIVYDVDRNQLDLSGDAYLTAGCSEFNSEHMVYDITDQRVQADSRDNSKVSSKYHCNQSSKP
jgi:lipopolysaccharide transport protein LptA